MLKKMMMLAAMALALVSVTGVTSNPQNPPAFLRSLRRRQLASAVRHIPPGSHAAQAPR